MSENTITKIMEGGEKGGEKGEEKGEGEGEGEEGEAERRGRGCE